MAVEPGLAGDKLQDGIDLADRLVHAPVADVVQIYDDPVRVYAGGEQLVESPPDGATIFIAANGEWTDIEPSASLMHEDDADYLVPLFESGIAALEGRIPGDLPELYENPLRTASYAARELGVEAIALWGSDEWLGICGGAVLDATGAVVLAHSEFDVEEIRRCAASRERSMTDDDDPSDLDDLIDRDAVNVTFSSGRIERQEGTSTMQALDDLLKDRNASQPFDPITLWGMWAPDAEIWVARPR